MLSNKLRTTKILNFLLVFAIIIGILAFFKDLKASIDFGGLDLRNRVVGARLLHRGLDPYYFKWTPGTDEKLLDPLDNPELSFTRVTVPPTILLFHLPLSVLPYFQQKIIWFLFQWFALITSCFLIIRTYPNRIRQKTTWIFALIFIFGIHFWRLHVEVGQIYVLYVLLLSLAYYSLQHKSNFQEIIAGFLIGLTASFRLPIIIMILPMIIFKKVKLLVATASGFCLTLLASYIIAKPQTWSSYFSAMRTIGKFDPSLVAKIPNYNEQFIIPKTVEGVGNFALGLNFNNNSSLQALFKQLFDFSINGNILIAACCLILLAFGILISSHYKTEIHQHQNFNWDIFFLCGTLMILIADFFIPAPRYVYNDIQFTIPLLLILKNINYSNQKATIYIWLLLIGFLLLSGMFYWMPYSVRIGEYTITIVMILITLLKGGLNSNTLINHINQNNENEE